MKTYPKATDFKGQKQPYPAEQSKMDPLPETEFSHYKPAGKLKGKVALITGADSGIGRAVAIGFCLEGAKVAILYNENDDDATETKTLCEKAGGTCLIIKSDVRDSQACKDAVQRTVDQYGVLNILVNNAAYQMAQKKFEDITEEQLRRTFETNILGYFFMAQAALPFLKEGDSIINTGSIVGKTGIPILIDYSSTKGAIHSFTKSLALNLGDRGIRVNCVVPGPVWTPNIPGTMPIEEVENFGHEVILKRPGQPEELAPAYILLASDDGSFMTGSFIHVTGGKLSSD
ncbi:SDR family oxidoreductase [Dyadobacter subterraneus]|uniref:SDR family oxidoreductase n=1 Tax=Dyadobacter subterraneus TaxID=2773304 RepID=A0ABR9WE76_9BACT|nr:SDR family oxidoreductase [Dyadobacter subterraneus]MBE9462651.1 SDR family oxidoreductase [Dyadobacter subterraneus]